MIAGVVSLNNKYKIDPQLINEMRKTFFCNKSLKIKELDLENAFLLRLNMGALTDYSGVYNDGKDSVSLIAGEPLITTGGIESDHKLITDALFKKKFEILKNSRGVFCVAQYKRTDSPLLQLCADKLGVRPIYYWTNGSFVVFSTLLKVLENISFIPKEADEIALSEIIAFGIPLSNRTKYKHIKLIRESEIIQFTLNDVKTFTYWRWDNIEQNNTPVEEAKIEAYRIFKEAIKVRLHDDSSALAFLSGGMDSRTIVGTMIDMGVDVQAFNSSPEGSQDQVFAIQYAEKAVCQLHLMPLIEWRIHLARAVKGFVQKEKVDVARPRSIWSGDGGSVGLGCVYLDKEIVELMGSIGRLDAVQFFRKKNSYSLPLKAIKSNRKKFMSGLLDNVILEELNRLECPDPGQSLFLFLMLNDQRRHLHDVYEDIDIHNIEYQLPFFDSVFLEYIFSLPLDYRLNHQFYTEWFNLLPSSVRSVPWQTYPGHVPCPLPIDQSLGYQWEKKKLSFWGNLKKKLLLGSFGLKLVFTSSTIGPLSRPKFFFASIAHLFGVRDCAGLINAGKIYSNEFLEKHFLT